MSKVQSWHSYMEPQDRHLEDNEDPKKWYGRTFVVTPVPEQGEGPITRFRFWYADAETGDLYVYHVGLLMEDRLDDAFPFLDGLAREVWRYYLDNKVVLTQRRVGPISNEYRATKT